MSIDTVTNADWSQFSRHDETVSVEPVLTPGEEIAADAAWAARVQSALQQRAAGQVRPISDVLDEVDADE